MYYLINAFEILVHELTSLDHSSLFYNYSMMLARGAGCCSVGCSGPYNRTNTLGHSGNPENLSKML